MEDKLKPITIELKSITDHIIDAKDIVYTFEQLFNALRDMQRRIIDVEEDLKDQHERLKLLEKLK